MSFISEAFVAFILVTWLVYYITPARFRWVVLLVASYAFYALSNYRSIPYMLFTTLSIFAFAIWIENIQKKSKAKAAQMREGGSSSDEIKALKRATTRKKRWLVFIVLLVNFGILCFFKVGSKGVTALNSLLELVHLPLSFTTIALPLGLSFFTFQSVGYLLDVYKDKQKADRNIFKFALFVSFFPQLVQGPISRYHQLASQLTQPHRFDYKTFTFGVQRIVWGYFKKLLIADRLSVFSNTIFGAYADYSGAMYILGILMYGVELYADFSGGIDITIGIAQTLGIEMTPNFMRPYFSTSLAEFWRRWHITLGAWMREYVFFTLVLSKAFTRLTKWLRKHGGVFLSKTVPSCLATYVVFMLVGIWHGSTINYLLFGLCQGTIIALGALMDPVFKKTKDLLRIDSTQGGWKVFQMLRTFALVSFSRLFVRASSLDSAMHIIKGSLNAMLHPINTFNTMNANILDFGLSQQQLVVALIACVVLFMISVFQEKGVGIREWIAKQHILIRWPIYLAFVVFIVVYGAYGLGAAATSFRYGGY